MKATAPIPLSLDIFSDPICPWCYIGLKRLDEALAELDRPVETRWRCFMLNPNMPEGGMDRRTYLERKFGGPEDARRVYSAIDTAAKRAGLSLDFDRITRTPATWTAHQALREAHQLGAADALSRALFAAYFKDGQDIGDPTVLAALWAAVGLDPARLAHVLEKHIHRAALDAEQQAARARGISGVPFFIVNGIHALSGAQDKSVLLQVFSLRPGPQAAAA